MRGAALLLAGVILGQEQYPIALVHGELLEREGTDSRGEVAFRGPDAKVIRCIYDSRTYIENQKMRITATSLRPKDPVQVVMDWIRWEGKCYARSIRVSDPQPETKGRLKPYSLATEHIVPRGNLTYAGVVIRVSEGQLVLQTRSEGRLTLRLREDTRFLSEGSPVGVSKLHPNTRVFVRAGKSYADELEAYQVTWGEILNPR